MRKLIAVGVLVGTLLAGLGSASAQLLPIQGGIGDPLTLASSGVLQPFLNTGASGVTATLEVLSPTGWNDGSSGLSGIPPFSGEQLHVVFYNNTCARVTSRFIPATRDDVVFLNITQQIPALVTNGLAAIAASPANNGFNLVPLSNPIFSRIYQFDVASGQSRVIDPIILDTFDYPTGNIVDIGLAGSIGGPTVWSPLRTGAGFFSPRETPTVNTRLIVVCPRNSIQGGVGATTGAFPNVQPSATIPGLASFSGFPSINHPLWSGLPASAIGGWTPQGLQGVIYDDNEHKLADITTTCDCVTELSVNDLDALVYKTAIDGTYTELWVANDLLGDFVMYKQSFTVGAPINNFSHRVSNGNKFSMQGVVGGAANPNALHPLLNFR